MRLFYRLIPAPPALPTASFIEASANELGSDFQDYEFSAELVERENYTGWNFNSFAIRGSFANFVISYLRNDPNFYNNLVEVLIYPCEGYDWSVRGFIKPHLVDDNCEEGCIVTVTPATDSAIEECLMASLIDNINPITGYFAEPVFNTGGNVFSFAPPPYQHPAFPCCNHSNYLVFTAVVVFFAIMTATVVGLPALIAILFSIGGGAGGALDLLEDLRGCNEWVVAPFIRDFLTNGAAPCGVVIDDTVFAFGSPYHNDVLFSKIGGAGSSKGVEDWYMHQNSLNWTMRDLLEFICEYYNAKWRLDGNVLKIRHKHENFGTPVLDVSGEAMCCSYTGEQRWAYGEYEHQRDGVEAKGNEVLNLYDDMVDFNNPPTPNQRNRRAVQFDSAAVRFYDDALGVNRLSKIENSTVGGFAWGILIGFLEGLASIPFIGNGQKWQNPEGFILLERDSTTYYKVIAYDPATPLIDARAIQKPYGIGLKAALSTIGYNINANQSKWNVSGRYYNHIHPMNEDIHPFCPNRYALYESDNPRKNKRRFQTCTIEWANCNCGDLKALGLFDYPKVGYTVLYGGKEYEIQRIDISRDRIEITIIT